MSAPGPARAWQMIGAGVLFLSALMAAAPYLGPPLGFVVVTLPQVEFVSHVLPAVPAIAAGTLLVVRRHGSFLLAALVFFAALWNVATHLPLLGQATEGLVDWPSALWHSVPGIMLLLAGGALLAMTWRTEPSTTRPKASRKT